ncbi:MAG TPA: YraN family protein [Rhodanobacteraceae bacterium]|nr:YraN family protein [Rhodanobacteraceae bacterium]
MNARASGATFEQAALEHLQRAGLRLLARNFGTRFGELDLVMREAQAVVFVEVRYRRHRDFGGGAASVGTAKRERITRAAQAFLQAHPALAALPCRFDVVAFDGEAHLADCDWVRAAFEAS